jgi:hypothetical protein
MSDLEGRSTSDLTDPPWRIALSDRWHCHQLPGLRVVCEREDLRARIEALERELKIMGGKSARIRWAEGHGPDDPPMPATLLRDKLTDTISTVLLTQPSDLLPFNERPHLERTDLAQQEFNERTRHGEAT